MIKRSKNLKSTADSGWQSTHGPGTVAAGGFPDTVIEAGNLPRVMICDPMSERAIKWLAERCMVHYDPSISLDRDAMQRLLEVADVLVVRDFTPITVELLSQAKRLALLVNLGTHVPDELAQELNRRAVRVMQAEKASQAAVAEYVLAVSLMLLRRAYSSTLSIASGSWPHAALAVGGELNGKTVGLVGYTVAAHGVAKLMHALGLKVLCVQAAGAVNKKGELLDGFVQQVSADELMAQSDVISLHAAVGELVFDSARLAQLKRGALLINVSSAAQLDEAAVVQALRSGQLGGAALDVLSSEPPVSGNPFYGCPNLLLTPGISASTHEAAERASMELAERIAATLGVW
jgi:(S)-sulfolactate dehydrogenase